MKVPFAFYVGEQNLPPGVYSVRPNMGGTMFISSVTTGKGVAMINTYPGSYKYDAPSAFVFNRFGDQYFLSELRWQGFELARSVPKSALETEMAKTNSKR